MTVSPILNQQNSICSSLVFIINPIICITFLLLLQFQKDISSQNPNISNSTINRRNIESQQMITNKSNESFSNNNNNDNINSNSSSTPYEQTRKELESMNLDFNEFDSNPNDIPNLNTFSNQNQEIQHESQQNNHQRLNPLPFPTKRNKSNVCSDFNDAFARITRNESGIFFESDIIPIYL